MVVIITIFEFLLPVCVQGILLIRLVAVYRPSELSWSRNFAIYVPIVVFKIARLVNAGLATQHLLSQMPTDAGVIVAAQIVWGTIYVKIEWFLQLFDDMYVMLLNVAPSSTGADVPSRFVSGLFVYKLYIHLRESKQAGHETGHSSSGCRSLLSATH